MNDASVSRAFEGYTVGDMGNLDEDSRKAGRTDSPRLLAGSLSAADVAYLEGALGNPALNEDLVVMLLHNRRVSAGILRQVHEERRFRRSPRVQTGLACHPQMPRALAMNLVPFLNWRDLAQIANHLLAPAPVRRSALRYLGQRFDEMALGEQTHLARTAGRAVLPVMVQHGSPEVVGALLQNPHLTEEDLVALCSRRDTPPAILALVARDPKWTKRYRVRQVLVHHEHAPLAVVLGLLTGLLSPELEEIARRPDRPPVVRMAAQRILRRRYRSSGWRPRRAPEIYTLESDES
jgi:hypothetical protein